MHSSIAYLGVQGDFLLSCTHKLPLFIATLIMHSLIAYLGVQGDFNALQFREMMRGELSRYAKRGLANVLKVSLP